jgi:hypothetical protein
VLFLHGGKLRVILVALRVSVKSKIPHGAKCKAPAIFANTFVELSMAVKANNILPDFMRYRASAQRSSQTLT